MVCLVPTGGGGGGGGGGGKQVMRARDTHCVCECARMSGSHQERRKCVLHFVCLK